MSNVFARLKQRKLVQWAIAYLAGVWVLLQVLALAAQSYHWPDIMKYAKFKPAVTHDKNRTAVSN